MPLIQIQRKFKAEFGPTFSCFEPQSDSLRESLDVLGFIQKRIQTLKNTQSAVTQEPISPLRTAIAGYKSNQPGVKEQATNLNISTEIQLCETALASIATFRTKYEEWKNNTESSEFYQKTQALLSLFRHALGDIARLYETQMSGELDAEKTELKNWCVAQQLKLGWELEGRFLEAAKAAESFAKSTSYSEQNPPALRQALSQSSSELQVSLPTSAQSQHEQSSQPQQSPLFKVVINPATVNEYISGLIPEDNLAYTVQEVENITDNILDPTGRIQNVDYAKEFGRGILLGNYQAPKKSVEDKVLIDGVENAFADLKITDPEVKKALLIRVNQGTPFSVIHGVVLPIISANLANFPASFLQLSAGIKTTNPSDNIAESQESVPWEIKISNPTSTLNTVEISMVAGVHIAKRLYTNIEEADRLNATQPQDGIIRAKFTIDKQVNEEPKMSAVSCEVEVFSGQLVPDGLILAQTPGFNLETPTNKNAHTQIISELCNYIVSTKTTPAENEHLLRIVENLTQEPSSTLSDDLSHFVKLTKEKLRGSPSEISTESKADLFVRLSKGEYAKEELQTILFPYLYIDEQRRVNIRKESVPAKGLEFFYEIYKYYAEGTFDYLQKNKEAISKAYTLGRVQLITEICNNVASTTTTPEENEQLSTLLNGFITPPPFVVSSIKTGPLSLSKDLSHFVEMTKEKMKLQTNVGQDKESSQTVTAHLFTKILDGSEFTKDDIKHLDQILLPYLYIDEKGNERLRHEEQLIKYGKDSVLVSLYTVYKTLQSNKNETFEFTGSLPKLLSDAASKNYLIPDPQDLKKIGEFLEEALEKDPKGLAFALNDVYKKHPATKCALDEFFSRGNPEARNKIAKKILTNATVIEHLNPEASARFISKLPKGATEALDSFARPKGLEAIKAFFSRILPLKFDLTSRWEAKDILTLASEALDLEAFMPLLEKSPGIFAPKNLLREKLLQNNGRDLVNFFVKAKDNFTESSPTLINTILKDKELTTALLAAKNINDLIVEKFEFSESLFIELSKRNSKLAEEEKIKLPVGVDVVALDNGNYQLQITDTKLADNVQLANRVAVLEDREDREDTESVGSIEPLPTGGDVHELPVDEGAAATAKGKVTAATIEPPKEAAVPLLPTTRPAAVGEEKQLPPPPLSPLKTTPVR